MDFEYVMQISVHSRCTCIFLVIDNNANATCILLVPSQKGDLIQNEKNLLQAAEDFYPFKDLGASA